MKTFKDTSQREWEIVVNVGQIKAVRDAVRVDLYSLFADEAQRLFSDPILLVDTLYALCRDQCKARSMTDIDFGRAFDGEVLENAANALLEEVVSFFPQSRQKILRATIDKSREMIEPIQAKILEKIAALNVTDLLKSARLAGILKIDPSPFTLRELVWMREGQEADEYYGRAVLTGVFNRLGDRDSQRLECEPPAWVSKERVSTSREEIALAREAFKAAVSHWGRH